MHALLSKYVDLPQSASTVETVILGSSKGAIEVEAPGLNRIRRNLARPEKLREVSLDGEYVSSPGEEGEISEKCPSKPQ